MKFIIQVKRVVDQSIITEVEADNEYRALEKVFAQVGDRQDWINDDIQYTNLTLIDEKIDIGAAFY